MDWERHIADAGYQQTGAKPLDIQMPAERNSPNNRPFVSEPIEESSPADRQAEMLEYHSSMFNGPPSQQAYSPDAFAAEQDGYDYGDLSEHPTIQAYEDAVLSGDTVTQLGIQAQLAEQAAAGAMYNTAAQMVQAEEEQRRVDAYAAEVLRKAGQKYGSGWDEAREHLGSAVHRNPGLLPDTGDVDADAEHLAIMGKAVYNRAVDAMTPAIGRQGGGNPEQADHLQDLMRRVR